MKTFNSIVFISRHDPSKPGGGCYATRAYLEALILLYPYKVTLFVAQGFEKEVIHGYDKLLKIIYVNERSHFQFLQDLLTNRYSKFENALSRWMQSNTVDLAILDNGIIGGSYVKKLKRGKAQVVTIHHNNEIDYHRDNRTLDSLRGHYVKWIDNVQRRAYQQSDQNLFLTDNDKTYFEKIYGSREENHVIGCYEFHKEVANDRCVDYRYFDKNSIHLIATGTLSAIQTKESIYWFVQQIYKKLQNTHLMVAGRNPDEKLISFCTENDVDVIPSPPDMLEEIRKNDVYVCPVNLGGGLKLRIMDALKVGIVCLIQEKSFRGYELLGKQGYVFSFVDDQDFEAQLNKAIQQIESIPDLPQRIQSAYNELFSFDAGVERLHKILSKKNPSKIFQREARELFKRNIDRKEK